MSFTPAPSGPTSSTRTNAARFPWFTILVLLFVPGVVWIWQDRSAWMWDEAAYGKLTVELFTTLRRSPHEWVGALLHALPQRTPGLIWVGQFFVPLGAASGDVSRGLLLYILALQFAGVVLVYKTALRLFADSRIALVSALFVCGGSLFMGLGHLYFAEPFQGLGVALFFYVLAGADSRPLARSATLLGISALVAVFGRISSPLYLICPGAAFAVLCYRRRGNWKLELKLGPSGRLLAGLLLIGTCLLAAWLAVNLKSALAHVITASSGDAAGYYGARAGFWYKFPFWLRSLGRNFFHYSILPAFLVSAAMFVWSELRTRRKYDWTDTVVLSGVAQVVLTVLVFSLNINEDNRFLYPLYPFVGVAVGWMLYRLRNRWLTRLYWGVAFLQFGLVCGESLAVLPANHRLSPHLTVLELNSEKRAQLEFAAVQTCSKSSTPRPTFITGLSIPSFNQNSLAYYATLANYPSGRVCDYSNLGYAEASPERAWRRTIDMNPEAVLYLKDELDRVSPTDPFNRVSRPVFDRLRASPFFRMYIPPANPNLVIFEALHRTIWRVESALFAAEAGIWTRPEDRAVWRIHPSRRRSGPPTLLRYDGALPENAVFSGVIANANRECPGLEFDFNLTGAANRERPLRVEGPLLNKTIVQPLKNAAGSSLTVRLQSIDPEKDNIDGCWVTIEDVRVVEANKN